MVFLNPKELDTQIISDVRMDVRHLDEIDSNDDQISEGVVVEIDGRSYLWVDGEYENDIIFDRKLVEKVFEKIDSQATDARIKKVSYELEAKKKRLASEMQELQKLEEELKWLQHEQKKQEPEDITNEIF